MKSIAKKVQFPIKNPNKKTTVNKIVTTKFSSQQVQQKNNFVSQILEFLLKKNTVL